MRPLTIVGVLLILAGGWILLNGFSFTRSEQVAQVGPLEVETEERQAVPAWVGGVALVAGIALTVAGARRKSLV
jgi:hypothetical protein